MCRRPRVSLLPLLLTAFPAGLAAPVTFSVGGVPPAGQSLAVVLGAAAPTKLAPGPDGVLWSGTADVPPGGTYKYAFVDAGGAAVVTEPFERTAPQGTDKTLNEFWMRPMTTKDHPRLPQLWPAWPRGYSRLFDETYIPVIHITGDENAILPILKTKAGETAVDVVWVGKSETVTMKNLTFQAGGQSSKDYDKTQIGLKFPKGSSFEGRRDLKLRAGRTDPSFLRERAYTDLLNAVGVPSAQGCHARVYINKTYRGLYFFEDDVEAAWGEVTIRPGPGTPTSLSQVSAGGTGNFVFGSYDAYKFELNATDPDINDMIPAMKALADFPAATATAEQVSALKQHIDYSLVYRAGALEYLAAHWDGAWQSASNYLLAAVKSQWFVVSSDFDFTLGTLISLTNGSINATLDGWAFGSQRAGGGERPLFEKPLQNPQMRGEFLDVVKTIVQGVFHEQGVRSRLQSLHEFLRADFADDANPELNPILSTGKNFNWTVEHFDASWDKGANAANLNCDGWDCEYGIVSYIAAKSEAVAGLYGFTFADTYVPPKDGEWYGGQSAQAIQGGASAASVSADSAGTAVFSLARRARWLLPVTAAISARFAV